MNILITTIIIMVNTDYRDHIFTEVLRIINFCLATTHCTEKFQFVVDAWFWSQLCSTKMPKGKYALLLTIIIYMVVTLRYL